MTTDTLTTPTAVDPAVAERAALAAELAELASEVTLYDRARVTVRQRIAAIEAQDLAPIDEALHDLRQRETTTKAALALVDYRALGTNEDARRHAFEQVQRAAVNARNIVLNGPGGSRLNNVVNHLWNRVTAAWQGSAAKLVAPGSTYTHEQRSADHMEAFRAVRVELERLAALPMDEKVRVSDAFAFAQEQGFGIADRSDSRIVAPLH